MESCSQDQIMTSTAEILRLKKKNLLLFVFAALHLGGTELIQPDSLFATFQSSNFEFFHLSLCVCCINSELIRIKVHQMQII